MKEVNLDELHALREEAEWYEEKVIIWQGEKFTLPAELPWRATLLLADPLRQEEGFRALLGEEQFDRFIAGDPSVKDIEALAGRLQTMYVGGSGEASSASRSSSRGSRASARPTSNASTASS